MEEQWLRTAIIRKEVGLDEFVIMPSHFHGIIHFLERSSGSDVVGAHGHAPLRRPPLSLGSLVARFKGSVTRQVRWIRDDSSFRVWQRNYCEHIIRNEKELNAIRRYITENPNR